MVLQSGHSSVILRHRGPLEVHTSNGPATCDVDVLIPSEVVKLETSNGTVTPSVPAGTQANFDVSTSNAEATVSGFPSISYSRADRTRKTGAINGGGANLALSTSNAPASLNGR